MSVMLAFGLCPMPTHLLGPSQCPTLKGGKRVTASVEGAELVPECQVLGLKRAL